MLKKTIAIVCALCLIFSLVSCADSSESSTQTSADSSSQTPVNSDDESTLDSTVSSKPKSDKTLWKRKMVAITVDDGPKDCTEKLLDGLKGKNAKVTFFLLGQNIDKRPDLVKRMVDEGHTIGWHSYDHEIKSTTKDKDVEQNFKLAQETLDKHGINYKYKFYRNPGGQKSEIIDKYAQQYGFSIFEWTNGNFNDKLPTAKQMCDSTFEGVVTSGSVILVHDYNETVVDGILLLVDTLIEKGFEVVNLEELMKRKNGGKPGVHYANGAIIW